MIEPGVSQQVADRSRHAGLFVPRPEDDTTHLRQYDGAGALGARFKRDVESCAGKTIFAGVGEGALQREKLGMGGRIPASHRFVVSLAENHSLLHYNSADRYFACCFRRPGQFECPLEPGTIFGPERRLRHSLPRVPVPSG